MRVWLASDKMLYARFPKFSYPDDDILYLHYQVLQIASFFYLKHTTAAHFKSELRSSMKTEEVLQVLCMSTEYEELPVRHNEDQLNSVLADKVVVDELSLLQLVYFWAIVYWNFLAFTGQVWSGQKVFRWPTYESKFTTTSSFRPCNPASKRLYYRHQDGSGQLCSASPSNDRHLRREWMAEHNSSSMFIFVPFSSRESFIITIVFA